MAELPRVISRSHLCYADYPAHCLPTDYFSGVRWNLVCSIGDSEHGDGSNHSTGRDEPLCGKGHFRSSYC